MTRYLPILVLIAILISPLRALPLPDAAAVTRPAPSNHTQPHQPAAQPPQEDQPFKSYLPWVAVPRGHVNEEILKFQLHNPCQVEKYFTEILTQTNEIDANCILPTSFQFETAEAIRFDRRGSLIFDLQALKNLEGRPIINPPSIFYRIEAVLEDAGQTDAMAAIGVFDSLWEAPAPGGVHGISVGIKDNQHTFWYASTQFTPVSGTATLDAESQDFLDKFDLGKRDRPQSGTKDASIHIYVTPNGVYPVINGVNWGSFPTLNAGSFTYTQTNDLRYVVLSKWDRGATPVRFKRLNIFQLDAQIDSVDEVNAHFLRQQVRHLPPLSIAPTTCSITNGASNSSNALWQAFIYRGYDYYFRVNHPENSQATIRQLVDTYLNNLPNCVNLALNAYANAKVTVHDCSKDPTEQLGTVFWVNHDYISRMHFDTRVIYALSGMLTAAQIAKFQSAFAPLIDTSMQHIYDDGKFPAAGNCHVDDTFAEEISWLLMMYAGYYTLYPTDQPRADKLLDYIKFLGFIHLSDGRTINEVFPNLQFTHLGEEYRNFRTRYSHVDASDPQNPRNGYLDNHGFHPSLHYTLGILGGAAISRNLLAKRAITTEQIPTLMHNVEIIYQDTVVDYLNLQTLRHAQFVANPRLSWCNETAGSQRDRYVYNADRTVILVFTGCSTPSGVEDWGVTQTNYANLAAYDDQDAMLTQARNVYFNYYPGAGEMFCNNFENRCSTWTNIYTFALNAMAFGLGTEYTP